MGPVSCERARRGRRKPNILALALKRPSSAAIVFSRADFFLHIERRASTEYMYCVENGSPVEHQR